jgi:hypothetical protein
MAIQTVFCRRDLQRRSMNIVQGFQIVRKPIYLLGSGLTLLIWAAYMIWRRPILIAQVDNYYLEHVPTALTAIPFAAILALGLSAVAILFAANRTRLWVVLRPNRGRLIGSLILTTITPFAVFNWVPWIVGVLLLALPNLFHTPIWISAGAVGTFLGISALWYPISSLIVSGIKFYWTRFWLFSLMFWSSYSAHILWSGVLYFRL